MPDKPSQVRRREPKHLLLYSTNTWLAYKISKEYYGDVHYVWCSPFFSDKSVPAYDYTNPPSSSPSEIYERLWLDVTRGDLHSPKIAANKTGIIEGANKKAASGTISEVQKKEIYSIVKQAETMNFRPLLYVIPFALVAEVVEDVPVKSRAHPFSTEFTIESLPKSYFDIIEYRFQ